MSYYMTTYSGKMITRESGSPTLNDIMLSLRRIPRFAGHTSEDWSVLQHTLFVHQLVQPVTRGSALYHCISLLTLIHDFHESITSDIPKPWVTDDIKEFQADLDRRILFSVGASFHMPPEMVQLAQSYVRNADLRALHAEAVAFTKANSWAVSNDMDLDVLSYIRQWDLDEVESEIRYQLEFHIEELRAIYGQE
jgi:5'-deoxynucleotidase YfbR-like HD superfamily hydrolase